MEQELECKCGSGMFIAATEKSSKGKKVFITNMYFCHECGNTEMVKMI